MKLTINRWFYEVKINKKLTDLYIRFFNIQLNDLWITYIIWIKICLMNSWLMEVINGYVNFEELRQKIDVTY